ERGRDDGGKRNRAFFKTYRGAGDHLSLLIQTGAAGIELDDFSGGEHDGGDVIALGFDLLRVNQLGMRARHEQKQSCGDKGDDPAEHIADLLGRYTRLQPPSTT